MPAFITNWMANLLLLIIAVCARRFDYSNGYRLATIQKRNVLSHTDNKSGETGDGNHHWVNLKDDILDLNDDGRGKIAAFDIDGTLVREKPVLGELYCARQIVCWEAKMGQVKWPLEKMTFAELCGGHEKDNAKNLAPMPDMSKEQKYEMLLKPFAGQSIKEVRQKIKAWIPRYDFAYKAFHDLIIELSQNGWSILFVSVSFNDFVHAFAEVYFPGMDYRVLSSEAETTTDLGTGEPHRSLSGLADLILDTAGKVAQIAQWGMENYDDEHIQPLLAMGNTVTDALMCYSAARSGGLCVMVEHNTAKECDTCEYELWSEETKYVPLLRKVFPEGDTQDSMSSSPMWRFLKRDGLTRVHFLPLSDLPDPLFCQPSAPNGVNPCADE